MEILVLDNFDSFTYNLVHYLEQYDVHCNVIRNDTTLDEIKKIDFRGIVISPGTGTPHKAGCLLEVLDYYHYRLPILGICLGHQAIGQYFGHDLIKAPAPRHGKLTIVRHSDSLELFKGIPSPVTVVQYNSLVIDNATESGLEVIAKDENEVIMGIKHREYPVYGVQFHPEAALTEYGHTMIKNWLDLIKMKI